MVKFTESLKYYLEPDLLKLLILFAVTVDGRESSYEDYEIFCGGKVKWVSKNTPLNQLVSSGFDKTAGLLTYVCRSTVYDNNYGEQIFIGENSEASNCCKISWIERIICIPEFSLMKAF